MQRQPILEISNLSKTFYLHEQDKSIPSSMQVNLCVYPGKLTALVGPTGAGKSSVLKCVYRTYLASQGRILYWQANGEIVNLVDANEHTILKLRGREIGFVTQFLHALPRQPAEDVVAQPIINLGVERNKARERSRALLRALNVPERLWSISPSGFSGGEKQRINLARGMISKPRLLLLDEPTASLDTNTSNRVVNLLQEMKSEGVAMLAIFHQMDVSEKLADDIVTVQSPVDISGNLKETA